MRKELNILSFSLVLFFGMTGCQNVTSEPQSINQHKMVGCWESESGLAREVWVQDPSGWLFGYALNRNEKGKIIFFEQMRIETTQTPHTLIVSASNGDPVSFKHVATDNINEYMFENADHDFPQKIVYLSSDNRLDAYIDYIAGGQRVNFKKHACKT